MCVFIDFWKLETENSILHVFSFLHKLSFEYSFCFLPVLSCQTSVLVSKIENCFWKHKTMRKNNYQTYPKCVFLLTWKLETENSLLHVFSFLHKLSYENSFCFLVILGCQTNFLGPVWFRGVLSDMIQNS